MPPITPHHHVQTVATVVILAVAAAAATESAATLTIVKEYVFGVQALSTLTRPVSAAFETNHGDDL